MRTYFAFLFCCSLRILAYLTLVHSASGVRCFCTENCELGFCDSPWCLVGIRNSGSVIRTCGNEAASSLRICRKDVLDWTEVCACDVPYCNTFAFLRAQIENNRFAPNSESQTHADYGAPDDDDDVREFRVASYTVERDYLDRANGRPPADHHSRKGDVHFVKDDYMKHKRIEESYLILVLVIVPLIVGATAVLLVALNYYCNLC